MNAGHRDRPSGTGSLVERDGRFIARVNLANGRKVIRVRRTAEDAEAAIRQVMQERSDDLGPMYRLALDGKVIPKMSMGPRVGVTPRRRWEVLQRDGHRCVYCGAGPADSRLVVDHVIPVSNGGTNDLDNLVTACHECNAGKGSLDLVSGT